MVECMAETYKKWKMKLKKKKLYTYGLYMEKPMVETYKGEKNEKFLKKSKHVPDSTFVSPQLQGRS